MNAKTETRCILCLRNAIRKKFCEYHYEAFQSLRDHYEVWKTRYGEISWYDYLTRLNEIEYTGKWIKDVIEIELKKTKNE
jgi:hypothetical protein